MQPADYKIHEQVRRVLSRYWIDLSKLDVGTTNQVIYIRGTIKQMAGANAPAVLAAEQNIALIRQIETEIKRIPGNKGVVMKLDGFRKEGTAWSAAK